MVTRRRCSRIPHPGESHDLIELSANPGFLHAQDRAVPGLAPWQVFARGITRSTKRTGRNWETPSR